MLLYNPEREIDDFNLPINSEDNMLTGFNFQHIIDCYNASVKVKTPRTLKAFIQAELDMKVSEMWESFSLCKEEMFKQCGIEVKKNE